MRRTSAKIHETEIFDRLSRAETHEHIARALGLSRQYVTRVAARFRAELEEAADARKQAVVDGVVEAKQLAREHAPEAMRRLVTEMRTATSSKDRREAAIAILDRGGVRPGVDVGGEGFETLAAALLGAKRSVSDSSDADADEVREP